MNQTYRRMLPASICQLVDEVEGEMGNEIIVDENYVFGPEARYEGKVFMNAACIVDVMPDCSIKAILPVNGTPSVDTLSHEMLHFHRYVVQDIPKVIAPFLHPDDSEARRLSDQFLENELEHLVMVPYLAKRYGFFEGTEAYRKTLRRTWTVARTRRAWITENAATDSNTVMHTLLAWLHTRITLAGASDAAELSGMAAEVLSWSGLLTTAQWLEQEIRAAHAHKNPSEGKVLIAKALGEVLKPPGGWWGYYIKRRIFELVPLVW